MIPKKNRLSIAILLVLLAIILVRYTPALLATGDSTGDSWDGHGFLPVVLQAIPTATATPRPTATVTPLPTSTGTALLPTSTGTATVTPLPTSTATPQGLIFSDEFDANTLDSSKWNTHYFWGRTNSDNNEEEYYADDAFDFTGTYLRLRADRRDMAGFHYTSGMISSHDKFSFQYGYIEIRARVPAGKGLWPAFWLLPASKEYTSEIDILEVLGQEPTKVYMTNWSLNPDGSGDGFPIQSSYSGPDFSQAFHTFAVRWAPDSIIWYVDGQQRFQTSQAVPQQPMYIIANLAVGGSWPGSPNSNTPFPSYYDIDYIRVYQLGQ